MKECWSLFGLLKLVFKCFLRLFARSLSNFIGYIFLLFSTVCFRVCPQSACITGRIVTLVAFVRFFPSVRFQMCPQIACLRRCKVTLVAFVWLFSTVDFQMYPQCTWIRAGIIALFASVWLFSTVLCVFKCLLKALA